MNVSSIYNSIFTNSNKVANDLVKSQMPIVGNSNMNYQVDPSSTFGDMISNEIEKLNNQQVKADHMTQRFINGQEEDLHAVLITTEEARLSLELAVQVRNKCVEAYKEINNMQL